MKFAEIIGYPAIKEQLVRSVRQNRISHSQLFLGPEGSASMALALAYAQYISCENRGPDDSCGQCKSCKKYQKLIHPDLHFVYPVIKVPRLTNPVSSDYITEWRRFLLQSPFQDLNNWLAAMGAENQQAGIFAQESSEIIRKLNLKTFESAYKIMIIWYPEKMNASASNKLLKIIEEPPEKTVFLLVGQNMEKILGTILSRSQLLKIPKFKTPELSQQLALSYQLEPDMLNQIARIANGNYQQAMTIVEAEYLTQQAGGEGHFELFKQLMRLAFGANVPGLIEWVEQITKLGREQEKHFLEFCLRQLRENFALNASQNPNLAYLTNQEEEFAAKFHQFIHSGNIAQLYNEINQAHYHIERNGYDKIIFMDLGLKITKLLRKKPLAL